MPASQSIQSVLIVGGGIGGMSCAIELRKLGVNVEIVDIDPEWRVYGAGITITGPTLRAFKYVGVLDEVCELGAAFDGAKVFSADGRLLEEMVMPRVDPDVPPVGGIMRPVLHKILSTRTKASGATIRLGTTVTDIAETAHDITVAFSDGSRGTYDLVVAADGAFSKLRDRVFPNAPRPKFTGQAVYRLVAERPEGFDRSYFYIGANMKIGFNPVSPTHMYMFLLEYTPENPWLTTEEQPKRLYDLMAGFGGIVPQVRAGVLASDTVNYRPLEAVIQPLPWYHGRVVLLGDAAHATTPHLASGAGMAVEDAVVLAQEIQQATGVEQALLGYTQRRYQRCRLVVENSLRLGELEMRNGSAQEHANIMMSSLAELSKPF